MHARKLPRISESSFDRNYYDNDGIVKNVATDVYSNKFQNTHRISSSKAYTTSDYRVRSTSPEEMSKSRSSNRISSSRMSDKERVGEYYRYAIRRETDRGGGEDFSSRDRKYRNSDKSNCNNDSSVESKQVRSFGEWSEHHSSSGKKYYYNSRTEVSQWEKPREWGSSHADRRGCSNTVSSYRGTIHNENSNRSSTYLQVSHCDRTVDSSHTPIISTSVALSSPPVGNRSSESTFSSLSGSSRRSNIVYTGATDARDTSSYHHSNFMQHHPKSNNTTESGRYNSCGTEILNANYTRKRGYNTALHNVDMELSSPSRDATPPLEQEEFNSSLVSVQYSSTVAPTTTHNTLKSTQSLAVRNYSSSSPYQRGSEGPPTPTRSEQSDAVLEKSSVVTPLSNSDSTICLSPSLARYYRDTLISHVLGWPAEVIERACCRLSEENNSLCGLSVTKVSADLKMLRSLVRLTEIQTTLHEQRIIFLRQQSLDLEAMCQQPHGPGGGSGSSV